MENFPTIIMKKMKFLKQKFMEYFFENLNKIKLEEVYKVKM